MLAGIRMFGKFRWHRGNQQVVENTKLKKIPENSELQSVRLSRRLALESVIWLWAGPLDSRVTKAFLQHIVCPVLGTPRV